MKRDKKNEEKPDQPRTQRVQLDDFDFGVLRRPSTPCIQTALQEDIGNTSSKSMLWQNMPKLVFTYKKNQTDRKQLTARGRVILSRIRYLWNMARLR